MDSSLGIIAVVLGAIALLLFLILKLKIHEVLALLIVSVVAGLAFGMSPAFVFETIEKGMGSTLGFLAVVIAIGSMFGEVMKISGGVQNLVVVVLHCLLSGVGRSLFPAAGGQQQSQGKGTGDYMSFHGCLLCFSVGGVR